MTRKNFLFVFAVVAFLSTATWAQVSNKELPNKEKVIAGAERAFDKFTRVSVAPAPGCAAAVSLNGETVFEKAFGLADLEFNVRIHRKQFLSQAQSRNSSPPQRSYSCNKMESSASTIRSENTFLNCPTTVRH
jgi:hypothetical protein